MTRLHPSLTDALVRVAGAERLLLGCDFDGTLAPIVAEPSLVVPLPESVGAVFAIAALPRTTCAIVSGRSLRELGVLLGPPGLVRLVGSHGAEHDIDGLALPGVDEPLRARLVLEASRLAAGVDGVLVERKPSGVALHVRLASRADAGRVLEAVRTGASTWDGVRTLHGKEVVELSVVDVDKGVAFAALREQAAASASVFLGDDTTDEHVFELAGPGDVTVKVGAGPTAAAYRVDDPAVVAEALELLLAERSARTIPTTST